jgi:hypothetical protein
MEVDYPAAHSMDTYWFAIDERGQVAVFDTDENGHVPAGLPNNFLDGEYWGVLEHLRLCAGAVDGLPEQWGNGGVSVYDYDDDYGGLLRHYKRTFQPAVPLHVDQLPFSLRVLLRSVTFAGLRFDQAEAIQPVEFIACQFYSPGYQVAYLSSDGVTVRPVPGREGEFAEFVRRYRERHPELAERLRFEGPTDYPAAHSMDAYWFAIDKHGHVAAFETGECGHAPPKDNDVFEELYVLYFGPYDYDANDGWDPAEWARRLGLTFYAYPDDYKTLIKPYRRVVTPQRPLHVDQLPPQLREKCGDVRFWMLRFDELESLQPFEYELDDLNRWEVFDVENHPAYLCRDGVTVRPVPGEEASFADFVRESREGNAEEAARMRFDGPKGRKK